MINGKSILAIIPARGGSKGVSQKNIRIVAGKPLIAWTIEEARKSHFIDRIILSSEDPEIMEMARTWGCEVPFIRPAELARDDTPGVAPVLHAIGALQERYDYVVMLQPTSPLREVGDIDGCIKTCLESAAPACVSVTEPCKSPFWMYTVDGDGKMKPFVETAEKYTRRQDLPEVYALDGAVYVAECSWLEINRTFVTSDTRAYRMPRERSVDIDTELDMICAESLLLNLQNGVRGMGE